MKKALRVVCLCLCLCLMLSAAVSANSPPNAEFEGGGIGVGPFLLYLLFVVLSVLLTVLVEWTVSLLFRLKAARIIIWTNIVSQLIMHFLYLIVTLLTLGFVSSTYLIVVLELLVLVGEWGFYTHKLSGVSRLRVFFYTLTANLLSLFLGGLGTFLLL